MDQKGVARRIAVVLTLSVLAPFTFAVAGHADPPARSAPTPDIEMQVAHHAARDRQIAAWWTAVANYRHNVAVLQAVARSRARQAREAASRGVRHETGAHGQRIQATGVGSCGGNLPPCYVMMRESRGSLTAENPVSTASGKWQFLDSTWGGYGGYSHAADAPESVQDARAREVWAGGAGCSNWSAC
jgi:hypothetical protein